MQIIEIPLEAVFLADAFNIFEVVPVACKAMNDTLCSVRENILEPGMHYHF